MSSEPTMIDRVARAIYYGKARNKRWELLQPEFQRQYEKQARAAIESMRDLPIEIQMTGCQAQSMCSIELDGPLKKHEDCNEPDDWMQRGHGLAKRMMSGQEFMSGWKAAIDAALNKDASR